MENTTSLFVHVVIKSLCVCIARKDEETAASAAVIPFIFVLSSFLSSPSCYSTQDNSIFGIYLAFQTLKFSIKLSIKFWSFLGLDTATCLCVSI